MSHPPIHLSSVALCTNAIYPFTHTLLLGSGPWLHESHLELPGMVLEIHARPAHNYVLIAHVAGLNYAEPFDASLSHFAGCVSTLVKACGTHNPLACKHLLQGVSNAMVYFARQYGYVDFDVEEGVVTATTKRDL